jgi:DnaJ family protein C protein 28
MAEEKPDEPAESPEDKPLPRIPPPGRWADVIDEVIEEAMRAGTFDNLPGRGKPLKLNHNPHAPETDLAFQLLKDNDYTLPWIAERKEVIADIDALRDDISLVWSRYSAEFRVTHSDTVRMALSVDWLKRQETWLERIKKINRRIADVNLKQPGERFEILKLTLDGELERTGATRDLG